MKIIFLMIFALTSILVENALMGLPGELFKVGEIFEITTAKDAQELKQRIEKAEKDKDFQQLLNEKKRKSEVDYLLKEDVSSTEYLEHENALMSGYHNYLRELPNESVARTLRDYERSLANEQKQLSEKLTENSGQLEAYDNATKALREAEIQLGKSIESTYAANSTLEQIQQNQSFFRRLAEKFTTFLRTLLTKFSKASTAVQKEQIIREGSVAIERQFSQLQNFITDLQTLVLSVPGTIEVAEAVFETTNNRNGIAIVRNKLEKAQVDLEAFLDLLNDETIATAVQKNQELSSALKINLPAFEPTGPAQHLNGVGSFEEVANGATVRKVVEDRLSQVKEALAKLQ